MPDLTHPQLIELMTALGYAADKEGMCHGLGHMAKDAILSNDLFVYAARLKLLAKLSGTELVSLLEKYQAERLKIIKLVDKDKIKCACNGLSEKEVETQLQTVGLGETLAKINNRHKLTHEAKYHRKKQLLIHYKIQKAIKRQEKKYLPEDVRLMLDVPNFFDGVTMYQQASDYLGIFKPNKHPHEQEKFSDVVSPLLQGKQQSTQVGLLHGVYNKNELTDLFCNLRALYQKRSCPYPIAFVISIASHTLTVTFNPLTQKWTIANNTQIGDVAEHSIAEKLVSNLSDTEFLPISCRIYVRNEHTSEMETIVKEMTDGDTYKNLVKVTEDKAKRIGSFSSSWLFIAALCGLTEVVNELIAKGADINLKSERQHVTPIFGASDKPDIFKNLIDHGADLTIETETANIFHFVATSNSVINMELLLKKCHPNDYKKTQRTALGIALCNGYEEMARILLKAKVDPNEQHCEVLPLCIAATLGSLPMIKLLIHHQAEVNCTNDYDVTPTYVAAQNGHLACLQYLYENGGDLHKNILGLSEVLLERAEQINKKNEVETLLKSLHNGIIPKTISNVSPLHGAVFFGHIDVVRFLLQKGSDINQKAQGITPLDIARTLDDQAMIDVLTEHQLRLSHKQKPTAIGFFSALKKERCLSSPAKPKTPKSLI